MKIASGRSLIFNPRCRRANCRKLGLLLRRAECHFHFCAATARATGFSIEERNVAFTVAKSPRLAKRATSRIGLRKKNRERERYLCSYVSATRGQRRPIVGRNAGRSDGDGLLRCFAANRGAGIGIGSR